MVYNTKKKSEIQGKVFKNGRDTVSNRIHHSPTNSKWLDTPLANQCMNPLSFWRNSDLLGLCFCCDDVSPEYAHYTPMKHALTWDPYRSSYKVDRIHCMKTGGSTSTIGRPCYTNLGQAKVSQPNQGVLLPLVLPLQQPTWFACSIQFTIPSPWVSIKAYLLLQIVGWRHEFPLYFSSHKNKLLRPLVKEEAMVVADNNNVEDER